MISTTYSGLKWSRRPVDRSAVAPFSQLRLLREAERSAAEAAKDLDFGAAPPEPVPSPPAARGPVDSELLIRVAKLEARPMTVAEAARVLGVAEKTVRRRIDAGTLASTRTGRRVVVHLDQDPVGELARRARAGRPRRRSAS